MSRDDHDEDLEFEPYVPDREDETVVGDFDEDEELDLDEYDLADNIKWGEGEEQDG